MKKIILISVSCIFLVGCFSNEIEYVDDYWLNDEILEEEIVTCVKTDTDIEVEVRYVYNENEEIIEYTNNQTLKYISLGTNNYNYILEQLLNYVILVSSYDGIYIDIQADDNSLTIYINYQFDLSITNVEKITEIEELTNTTFNTEVLEYSSKSLYATYEAAGYECEK